MQKQQMPLPREHGAWVMLATPLLTGLFLAPQWHPRALLLVIASLGAFLLHEPLGLLVKIRKHTNKEETRKSLWRWSFLYGAIGVIPLLWLILVDKLYVLIPFSIVGGIGLLLNLWFVKRREVMSYPSEIIGVTGLALAAPMIYFTASLTLDSTAWTIWLLNSLYFMGSIFYVKLKIRIQARSPAPTGWMKRLQPALPCLTFHGVGLLLVLVFSWAETISLLGLFLLLPTFIKVAIGSSKWEDKQSLDPLKIGIIESITTLLFVTFLFSFFH